MANTRLPFPLSGEEQLPEQRGTLSLQPGCRPGPVGATVPHHEVKAAIHTGLVWTEPSVEGIFWEAYDFEDDYPGTGIPEAFTLRIGTTVFRIKPHGTKHMKEFSEAHFHGPATIYSQTVFPISSLAGSLEQAEARGDLDALFEGKIDRLGTQDDPYVVGGWELSIEYDEDLGRFEVFHAVYR